VLENLPVGDLALFDNNVPKLKAGNWGIEVTHDLDGITKTPFSAKQKFVVSAPQFAIPPSEVIAKYPPDGTSGRYDEVLPHIVLNEPLLPWERTMKAGEGTPWLALLVFEEGELLGGDPATHTCITTIKDFLDANQHIAKTLYPQPPKEADVDESAACAFIRVPTDVFRDITPRLEELRYLACCRQANTGDKPIAGLNGQGLAAVVVASRFPAAPAGNASAPIKNIAHLVSLEKLEDSLVDAPNFGGNDAVALLSLASWTFHCLPDHAQDFAGLVNAFVASETEGNQKTPSRLWLSLPVPELKSGDPSRDQVLRRIRDGFVPLEYHTRTGEDTFAWYRGPLVPVSTAPVKKEKDDPFLTADSAIIYQKDFGVFDLSLAAAWETGRAIALADKAFGQLLLDMRLRTHRLIDAILHRLRSDHFSAKSIADLDEDTTVQDELLKLLHAQLLQDIGSPPPREPTALPPRAQVEPTNPKAVLANFLEQDEVKAKMLEQVQEDLDPIAQWLAKLLLLYPVPFPCLVPDERMLPVESLRFFYLDNNWLGALLDGALSIGMESSKQTHFARMTRGLFQKAALEAAAVHRDSLRGVKADPAPTQGALMSGLLLRSALVSGWPNLAVRPRRKKDGSLLKILRLDRLSPSVLLCIFDGIPDMVEFSEPQEGFRLGVDGEGKIPLRNILSTNPGNLPLGHQLDERILVRDLSQANPFHMRSKTSRVLKLSPLSPDGLVQQLQKALGVALKTTVPSLGPADFTLQMIKAPEAIQFVTQP
jgi:hypothetical protein